MFRLLSAMLLSGLAIITASTFIPSNYTDYNFPTLSDKVLSKYDTLYASTSEGHSVYGNGLILDNVSRIAVDVDVNPNTSNSSSIVVSSAPYSHAFLVYMVSGDKLNIDKDMFSAMLSTDGEEYITILPETSGRVGKNQYIAIADISQSFALLGGEVYVSLPIMEDSQNARNISAAGFYIITLDSSGENLSEFSFSLKSEAKLVNNSSKDVLPSREVSLGLGLKSGSTKFLKNASLRDPSSGFTERNDIELGKSLTGDFGVLRNSGLIFINSIGTNIPAPKVDILVENSSELSPYYRISVDTSIRENLVGSSARLSSPYILNYVKNSGIIPPGYPMSGPVSDILDDDVFSYMDGKLDFEIENISLRSKVSFSTIYSQLTNNFALNSIYNYNGKKYNVKTNRIMLKPSTIWTDIGVYAELEKDSPTAGLVKLFFTSEHRGNISKMTYRLPEGLAIRESDLESLPCGVETLTYETLLKCDVSFEDSNINSLEIKVLFRLNPAEIDFGTLDFQLIGTSVQDYFPINNTYSIRY